MPYSKDPTKILLLHYTCSNSFFSLTYQKIIVSPQIDVPHFWSIYVLYKFLRAFRGSEFSRNGFYFFRILHILWEMKTLPLFRLSIGVFLCDTFYSFIWESAYWLQRLPWSSTPQLIYYFIALCPSKVIAVVLLHNYLIGFDEGSPLAAMATKWSSCNSHKTLAHAHTHTHTCLSSQ